MARYDLSLNDAEFYAMTPRQLDALVKRRERESQEREFMLAQLTAGVANFSMSRPREPFKSSDFMLSKAKPVGSAGKMTAAKRKAVAQAFRNAWGKIQ